mmetsp:Transcript_15231/g.18619  ORF Transcript_15231/g.18619 Transcript_15231/m.18619 type:complete len:268 (-) Transcript_15231:119-922(-)
MLFSLVKANWIQDPSSCTKSEKLSIFSLLNLLCCFTIGCIATFWYHILLGRRRKSFAHLGEHALDLLVLFLLSSHCLFVQNFGFSVAWVKLKDSLNVADALGVFVQTKGCLCATEQRLVIFTLLLQHVVAAPSCILVLLQLEMTGSLVQIAKPLELFGFCLVFLLEIVDVIQEIHDFLVPFQGQLNSPLLEEVGADFFPVLATLHLLIFCEFPLVLRIFEVEQLQNQHCLSTWGKTFESKQGLCAMAWPGACQNGALAFLHLHNCSF